MSRPARPNYTVRTFAINADYPAGSDAWSAQPIKVEPAGPDGGFVPGEGASAEEVNKLFNDGFNQDASALATQQAIFDWIGLEGIRNWGAPQTSVSGAAQVRYLAGKYYVGGSDAGAKTSFCRTIDPGVWPTTDEVGATPEVGSLLANFDVATDGSIVFPGSGVTDGTAVVECTPAGTWTKRTAVFPTALLNPDCVYEPVSGNWIVFGHKNGTGIPALSTSTNRTAWSSQTPPGSIPADGTLGPNVTLAKDGAGKVVAQFFPSSLPGTNSVNSISFSVSSDGGVTWSTVDTHTTTFASVGLANTPFAKPIWTGSTWVACVENETDLKTYVYTSSDGATWTQVALLTTVALRSLACDGDFLVALTSKGALVYSLDLGATWTQANMGLGAGTYLQLFGMNGGFVGIESGTTSKMRFSLVRSGLGGAAVT